MKPRLFIVATLLVILLSISLVARGSQVSDPNPSAPAVALGQPGLSFRYVQTFGVTEEAYPADVQHINGPWAVSVDNSDNLFVIDGGRGSRILKYRTSDGVNLLSIGKAGLQNRDTYTFDSSNDVAVDGSGNIWEVDNQRIGKYDASGNFLLEFPPADPWNSGSDNDHFDGPRGLAFDSAGRLFVADYNNQRIQVFEIVSGTPVYSATIGVTGVISSTDGYFYGPNHIAFDSSGRLYVVDTNNYRVQRCAFASNIWTCTTFFGEPGVTGTDLAHIGGWFNGLTIRNDNIFIADNVNQRVLKCNTSATCSVFAGVTGVGGSDNAHFLYPSDVAVDSAGNVYVSEYGNHRVQEFNSSGVWVRRFGVTQVPYVPDTVRYNTPRGLTVAADGSIYFTEGWGYRLVKLNAAGAQQWTVGQAGVEGSDNAHFRGQWDGLIGNVAVDAAGRVYVPDTGNDRMQIFNANTGAFITTWGSSGSGQSQFSCPWGVAISPVNDDFYVVDRCNNRIQIFDSNRVFKTQLGTGAYGSSNTEFAGPAGVAVDKQGNVYVADQDNNRVQKCTVSGVSYNCALFAGVVGQWGEDFDHLSGPYSVAVDNSNRVYVMEAGNQRVQVFDSSGAYLTTIGGGYGSYSGQMREPKGVALDNQGNVYVADSKNSRIQKFAPGVPGWRQKNINGFGAITNQGVIALSTFKNQLYAGTSNPSSTRAQLWRSSDGISWNSVTVNGFGDSANRAILCLFEFNGNLYAGVLNANGAQLWRSSDGTIWNRVTLTGFDGSHNDSFARLGTYNSKLYASAWNDTTQGGQIWVSATGDSGDWSQVTPSGFGDAQNASTLAFESFGGFLYAGTFNSTTGGEIWRSATGNSGTWTQVNVDGFGDSNNNSIASLTTFGDYLYASTSNWSGTGQKVWRCQVCAGSDWTQVLNNASDGPTSLEVLNGRLYAVVGNNVNGMEVWSTANGITWEQNASSGFGTSNNIGTWFDNSVTTFANSLYVATGNQANGGQIWQLLKQVYLPLVLRN